MKLVHETNDKSNTAMTIQQTLLTVSLSCTVPIPNPRCSQQLLAENHNFIPHPVCCS